MSQRNNVHHQNQLSSKNSYQQSKPQKHEFSNTYESMIKLSSTAKYYKCHKDEFDINDYATFDKTNHSNVDHQVLFSSLRIHSSQKQQPIYQPHKVPKLNLTNSPKVASNISVGYPRVYEDKQQYFTRQSAIIQNNPIYYQQQYQPIQGNPYISEYWRASQ